MVYKVFILLKKNNNTHFNFILRLQYSLLSSTKYIIFEDCKIVSTSNSYTYNN